MKSKRPMQKIAAKFVQVGMTLDNGLRTVTKVDFNRDHVDIHYVPALIEPMHCKPEQLVECELPDFARIDRIDTMDDVRAFFRWLHDDVELAFHPDDGFEGYGHTENGEWVQLFALVHCAELNKVMQACFEICEKNGEEIYEVGLESHPIHQHQKETEDMRRARELALQRDIDKLDEATDVEAID